VLADGRETFATSPLDAEPNAVMRMPEDSYAPALLAACVAAVAYGLLFSLTWLTVVGAVGVAACVIAWLWPDAATARFGNIETELGALPLGASGRRGVGWWGMVWLVATEAALFAYLLMSYFYLASISTNAWPADAPSPWLPLVNTAILLASSGTVLWSVRGVRRNDTTTLRRGLIASVGLGVLFLVLQAVEYSREPFGATDNAYGSLFYTITGFHGAHVFVGLIMLVVVLLRARRGHFAATQHEAVTNAAMYWNFVDVVWLAVFTTLYVTPHLR
jgi:cytochrome c oxidase subunit I+III